MTFTVLKHKENKKKQTNNLKILSSQLIFESKFFSELFGSLFNQ